MSSFELDMDRIQIINNFLDQEHLSGSDQLESANAEVQSASNIPLFY